MQLLQFDLYKIFRQKSGLMLLAGLIEFHCLLTDSFCDLRLEKAGVAL